MKKPRNYNYSHLSIPLTKNQKKVVKEKCEARGMSMSSLAKIVLFKEKKDICINIAFGIRIFSMFNKNVPFNLRIIIF